ncbi:MAG: hypothetical protein JWO82_228 [Akkermansiaceae bacterium]|nr:hypothetical protein [Akkermansiaceae bacterium]
MTPLPAPSPGRRKFVLYAFLFVAVIRGSLYFSKGDPKFAEKQAIDLQQAPLTPANRSLERVEIIQPKSYELNGLFDPDSGIDPQLVKDLALPAAKVPALNDLLRTLWPQQSAHLQSRWTAVPAESAADRTTFLAPADPAAADISLQALTASLRDILGDESARRLLPYLSAPRTFGSLGKNDIKVTLIRLPDVPGVNAPGDTLRISGNISDPITRKIIDKFRLSEPRAVRGWLGSALDSLTPPP